MQYYYINCKCVFDVYILKTIKNSLLMVWILNFIVRILSKLDFRDKAYNVLYDTGV